MLLSKTTAVTLFTFLCTSLTSRVYKCVILCTHGTWICKVCKNTWWQIKIGVFHMSWVMARVVYFLRQITAVFSCFVNRSTKNEKWKTITIVPQFNLTNVHHYYNYIINNNNNINLFFSCTLTIAVKRLLFLRVHYESLKKGNGSDLTKINKKYK